MKRLTRLFFCPFFVSCSDRTGIPNDIFPPDSMRTILKDVIMADEYSTNIFPRILPEHDKLKANQDLLEDHFKIHHITRETFKQSLSFYESRPDLNKIDFDSLLPMPTGNKHGIISAPLKPSCKTESADVRGKNKPHRFHNFM